MSRNDGEFLRTVWLMKKEAPACRSEPSADDNVSILSWTLSECSICV
jgi:hypothetical protein